MRLGREALTWSVVWAELGLSFGAFVYFGYERHWMGLGLLPPAQQAEAASLQPGQSGAVFVDRWAVSADNPHGLLDGTAALTKYVTSYLVEKSLAVERMERVRRGALMMTPLFFALLLVEFTDLIFAVDSIPAVFAITTDPFLVFTSNAFAILGLRSLYFALAGVMDKFQCLMVSLDVLLAVVGGKMIAHKPLKEAPGEHVHFTCSA